MMQMNRSIRILPNAESEELRNPNNNNNNWAVLQPSPVAQPYRFNPII